MIKVVQRRLSRILAAPVNRLQEPSCDGQRLLKELLSRILDARKLFSQAALAKFPPVMFPHLIFETDSDRSIVRRLAFLERDGAILRFKIPSCQPASALVLSKDVLLWSKQISTGIAESRVRRFIREVVPTLPLSSGNVTKTQLLQCKLTERDIGELIKAGFLVFMGDSKYELSIPCAGEFSKIFMEGRRAIMIALERSPDQELLKVDLMNKDTVKKRMFLGFDYHIADLIGLKLVDRIETTQGQLIRLLNEEVLS